MSGVPSSGQPRWAAVYHWDGPPTLDLEAAEVVRGNRRWLQHRLVADDGREGAVAVVVSPRGVLLVQQWRPAVGQWCWELPRGFGDPSDADVALTAEREVGEETGLRVIASRVIGSIRPDSGLLATTVAVVEVEVDPGPESDEPVTDGENIASRWVVPAVLSAEVRTGALRDGISLAALAVWGCVVDDAST